MDAQIDKYIENHAQLKQKHREKTNMCSSSLPSPYGVVCVELFVKLVESSLWNAKSIDFSLLIFFFFPPPFPSRPPVLLAERVAFVGI